MESPWQEGITRLRVDKNPSEFQILLIYFRTVLSRGSAGSSSEGPDGQLIFVKESDVYINLVSILNISKCISNFGKKLVLLL